MNILAHDRKEGPMAPITVMIKPASGSCNLRCAYCFYNDEMSKREVANHGMMRVDVLEQVIQKVLAHASGSCTMAFQGGEPTLCGLPFFQKAVELQNRYNVHQVKIHNVIQTNGYALDSEWGDFFKAHEFLVGVSLDGGPKIHNVYRKTPEGVDSFGQIMANVEMLKAKKVDFNILAVVNDMSALQIKKTYRFFKKNGLNYLQFIPCLDPLFEAPGTKDYGLSPGIYGQFLIELFNLWYEDALKGEAPYIRLFANYLSMLSGHEPEACDMGGICSLQYVVEADGAVYPCDFYAVDQWNLGNLTEDTMEAIDKRRQTLGFIPQSGHLNPDCNQCDYLGLCRGGCRRTRLEEEENAQYFCPAYKMFFDACLQRMLGLTQR